jgi:hypothetical protein
MLRTKRIALLATVTTALLALAIPASAGVVGPVDCTVNPAACTVTVTAPGADGHSGTSGTDTCKDLVGEPVPCYVPERGWWGGDGCWYQPSTGNDLATTVAFGGPAPPGKQWYTGSCGNPAVNDFPMVKFMLFGAGPGVEMLAQEAVKALRMPPPLIRVNPAAAAQLVRVPTWLWVDASTWGSRHATASAGGLSVTATAKATSVSWSTGDGGSVTCDGPGRAWKPGTNPAASSSCSHTYTTVPAGGQYTLSATVTWDISWAGSGQTGTEPALTTTAAIGLRVQQSAALNTNGG